MNRDNPYVKLNRYNRLWLRRFLLLKDVQTRVERLEKPFMKVELNTYNPPRYWRYCVEIDRKAMPKEYRKRCKRLRSLRYKLACSVEKLERETGNIREWLNNRDDFTKDLLRREAGLK